MKFLYGFVLLSAIGNTVIGAGFIEKGRSGLGVAYILLGVVAGCAAWERLNAGARS